LTLHGTNSLQQSSGEFSSGLFAQQRPAEENPSQLPVGIAFHRALTQATGISFMLIKDKDPKLPTQADGLSFATLYGCLNAAAAAFLFLVRCPAVIEHHNYSLVR